MSGAVQRFDPDGSGRRIHALHWRGRGAAVVLVHGMVVAGRSLVDAAAALAGHGLDVHVPDLAGFGLSAKPAEALGVDGLADSLAGWIRGRALEGGILVGNSFGTQVAAAAAARHPGVAGAVGLVAPTIDPKWRRRVPAPLLARPSARPARGRPGGGGWRRLVSELLASPWSPPARRPSMRRLIVTEYAAAGLLRTLGTYRYAIADRIEDRLAVITAPVLVARGSEDGLVTDGWARELAGLAPAGQFLAVPGATHDAEFEQPERFAATVLRLVDHVQPSSVTP